MGLLSAAAFLSFIGSLPPGLISLWVARTAVLHGFRMAMAVALGASLVEFFQAWGAVLFSEWLMRNPEIVQGLRWGIGPVFLGIAGYLWFWAKPPCIDLEAPKRQRAVQQFYKGMVISLFNLLAVPYWVVYAAWLHLHGWWQAGRGGNLLFAVGVVVGTLVALALYARLGHVLQVSGHRAHRIANRLVALIFIALAFGAMLQAAQR